MGADWSKSNEGSAPAVVPYVVGQVLGCMLFGYFAVVSLINARLGLRHSRETVGASGSEEERTRLFLRLWLVLNGIAFALLATAAVLIWFHWLVALVLACIPILLFVLANAVMGPAHAQDGH